MNGEHDHCVAGRHPKFSRSAQAFRHPDGTSADWRTARPAVDTRAEKRAFKRALRNYRKHVHPMADEPHSFWDSWLVLVPFGLMCFGILLARAWGWL
jgi:hypothetical protein